MTRFVPSGTPTIGWYSTINHWWTPIVLVVFVVCVAATVSNVATCLCPNRPRLRSVMHHCLFRCARVVCCLCRRGARGDDGDDGNDDDRLDSKKDK